MKRLFLLTIIFNALLIRPCEAQENILQSSAVDPLLKQVMLKRQGLIAFDRGNEPDKYINIAVLEESCGMLKWFNCYGQVFDSVHLTADEYNLIASKKTNPFSFYRNFYYYNILCTETVAIGYRLRGNAAVKDTGYNMQAVFNTSTVKGAQSTLQKLMAIENLLKSMCLHLYLFESRSPRLLKEYHNAPVELAGKMIQKTDSTEYYNINPLATAARIVLFKYAQDKMFVYNRHGQLTDSVPLKHGKYAILLKEKEDVFLLYRGWLEQNWQRVIEHKWETKKWLEDEGTGLYKNASWIASKKDLEPLLLQLEKQQKAIEDKISSLIVPTLSRVEQLLSTSHNDVSNEIRYLPGIGFAITLDYRRGQKQYELSDHRGNVLSVVSDKKKAADTNADGKIDYYNADVIAANDYYPFGMIMPGRSYSTTSSYRYGYNGKENDNDVKGTGNQQDYGRRIYDPRLGRFLSTDPLTKTYPGLTPYQFATNRPIDGIDLDGKEWTKTETYDPKTGVTNVHFDVKLKIINDSQIFRDVKTLKEEVMTQFATAFKDVGDEKTHYSGSITVTLGTKTDGDFSSTLYDNQDVAGGFTRGTNTKVNNSRVNAYDARKGVAPNTPRDAKSLAQDIVHELIHTAGPNHPDDVGQAEDIQLTRTDSYSPNGDLKVTFHLGPKAKLEYVIYNIMVYSNTRIEDKQVKELVPNKLDRNKVSPGQSQQITNQINKDEHKNP